jgi:hypothetical protein
LFFAGHAEIEYGVRGHLRTLWYEQLFVGGLIKMRHLPVSKKYAIFPWPTPDLKAPGPTKHTDFLIFGSIDFRFS